MLRAASTRPVADSLQRAKKIRLCCKSCASAAFAAKAVKPPPDRPHPHEMAGGWQGQEHQCAFRPACAGQRSMTGAGGMVVASGT